MAVAKITVKQLQGAINVVLGVALATILSNVKALTSFIDFKPQAKSDGSDKTKQQ